MKCPVVLIRSSVIGNFKNEDLFLEHEGMFLLLDLLEVCLVQGTMHTYLHTYGIERTCVCCTSECLLYTFITQGCVVCAGLPQQHAVTCAWSHSGHV